VKRAFKNPIRQNWIAVSTYVLMAIVRKRLNLDASLCCLLQRLSLTLCEKAPLQQAFPADAVNDFQSISTNRLNLFGS
jgi:hypothetical protein